MRKLCTLLMASLMTVSLFGQQSARQKEKTFDEVSQSLKYSDEKIQNDWDGQTTTSTTTSTPSVPLGTVTSDAVTSIKIGEASNGYTFTYEHVNLISVEPDAGTNGGSIALIHRQNIGSCGGVDPDDNGQLRYAISTDGGMSWDVGAGTNTGGVAPVTGCYGLGPLNPTYSQPSRHPNGALFLPPDSTKIENLGIVYAGPVLTAAGAGWDGAVLGYTDSVAFTPQTRQEVYPFSGGATQFYVYSLVERVDGEFFYLAYETDGTNITGNIFVNRGIWNPATEEIDWTVVQTLTPNFLDPANPTFTISLTLGFSPDGNTGFIGMLGDLKGGKDSVISLIHSKSVDGGQNWSTLEEFNFQDNDELQDSMHFFIYGIDTVANDTFYFGGEDLTTGFDLDLVVDKNGAPHFTLVVGHASFIDTTTLGHNLSSYAIFLGLEKFAFDVTYDSFGDLNLLYLDWQEEFSGDFGNLGAADPNEIMSFGPYLQASRNEDGSVVFFSWVDSDPANSNNGNDAPDLKTVAYDVDAGMMTPVTNWTADDGIWASSVLAPHSSPILLENGTVLTLPVTAMSFDLNNAIQQVSLWYFSDVSYDRATDFTVMPNFMYNCKEAPFANTSQIISPACGGVDGEIAVVPGGGTAPYTFAWSNGSDNDTISNLQAGIYEVIITDDRRCKDTITTVLSNPGAPDLTLSAVADITCAGADNGTATVNITTPVGTETFLWSNGETTATATGLPVGMAMCTVTDANGCQNFVTVNISEPNAIVSSFTTVDILCAGDSTGEIDASAFGGTGALSFSWDNGATDADLTGLQAGTYTGTIMDANGCTATLVATITEPPAISSSILAFDNSTADTAAYDGSAVATITGGVEPYFYRWSGPNNYADSGENVKFISNLCGGEYPLEVTDANGCVFYDTAFVGGPECMVASSIFGPVATGINSVSIFPNPTNGSFILSVELERREDLTMEVFNARGQSIIRRTSEGVLQLEENFSLEGQAAGIYMIKVTTNRGSATEKIMLN